MSAILLLLIVRQIVAPQEMALAVPADCDIPDTHIVGEVYDSSEWEVRGAQAKVYVREADLCTSDESESLAWLSFPRFHGHIPIRT